MEKITEHCSSLRFSKLSKLSVVSLAFICLLSFGFSASFLVLLVLIPSTLLLATFTKKKVSLNQSLVENQLILISGQDNSFEKKLQPSKETDSEIQIFPESEAGQKLKWQIELPEELSSDSESSYDPFENGDFGSNPWMCLGNLAQNLAFSEDSSSEEEEEEDDDDDSLIEITLPNPNASPTDLKRKTIQNLQPYLPDFLPDSILGQEELVELLAEINEINEEDNLIEIDLSKGFNQVHQCLEASDSAAKSEQFQ